MTKMIINNCAELQICEIAVNGSFFENCLRASWKALLTQKSGMPVPIYLRNEEAWSIAIDGGIGISSGDRSCLEWRMWLGTKSAALIAPRV